MGYCFFCISHLKQISHRQKNLFKRFDMKRSFFPSIAVKRHAIFETLFEMALHAIKQFPALSIKRNFKLKNEAPIVHVGRAKKKLLAIGHHQL